MEFKKVLHALHANNPVNNVEVNMEQKQTSELLVFLVTVTKKLCYKMKNSSYRKLHLGFYVTAKKPYPTQWKK